MSAVPDLPSPNLLTVRHTRVGEGFPSDGPPTWPTGAMPDSAGRPPFDPGSSSDTPAVDQSARDLSSGDPSTKQSQPSTATVDHLLPYHALFLDEIEKARLSSENRLRTLTSAEDWGMKINPLTPEIQRATAMLDQLRALEANAILNLKRVVRVHPLGGWVKATVGVGEKQAARLLAAIGDPYWNARDNRPRRGHRELWAYCGLDVVEHEVLPLQSIEPAMASESAVWGEAPRRRRGALAKWNHEARMRARLVAESCIKHRNSPYRTVYDAGREKYREAVHHGPCPQCGPKGKPATAGSPLSLGHQHARALRLVSKAILKDLFNEAKRVYGGSDVD